jgi:hypothetical protein
MYSFVTYKKGGQMGRWTCLASAPTLAAIAIAVAALPGASPDQGIAEGEGPGMELVCPDDVMTGEEFVCQLVTDPSPDIPISGFRSVIALPADVIDYLPQPCHSEVLVTHLGGAPVVTCVNELSGDDLFHAGGSDPPVEGLTLDVPAASSGTPLVQLTFVCLQPGTHNLRMQPEEGSDIDPGTAYFDEGGAVLLAKVNSQDVLCTGDPLPTPPPVPTPDVDGLFGMQLTGPASAPVGATFTIDVRADPVPTLPISGFGTELVFSSGLEWAQRPECQGAAGESQVTVGGGTTAVCERATGPGGEARFAVISRVQAPPLEEFDAPLGELLEIDVTCTSAGTHNAVLTAVSNQDFFPFGAIYFTTTTQELVVRTEPFDVDGDTSPEQVADVLEIDCTTGDPPEATVAGVISAPAAGDAETSGSGSHHWFAVATAVAASVLGTTFAFALARRP